MLTRSRLRWILTGVTGVSSLVIAPVITSNIEELAKQQGWDQKLVQWWPEIMAVIDAIGSIWTIAVFAFLLGATATMWVLRFIPEPAPAGLNLDQKAAGKWRQVEAITDDNPTGTYEFVGNGSQPILQAPGNTEAAVDYSLWGVRKSLRIYEAAKLMAGVSPNGGGETPETQGYEGLLKEKVKYGAIERSDVTYEAVKQAIKIAKGGAIWPGVDAYTQISMSSLLKYLEQVKIAEGFIQNIKPHIR